MKNCYIIRDEDDARIAIRTASQAPGGGLASFICIRPGAAVRFDALAIDPKLFNGTMRYVDFAAEAALEAKKLQERRLADNVFVVVRKPVIDRAERALARFGVAFRVLGRPECARLC